MNVHKSFDREIKRFVDIFYLVKHKDKIFESLDNTVKIWNVIVYNGTYAVIKLQYYYDNIKEKKVEE